MIETKYNLRYLAEEEGIHVCQGTIWSQYGIDNGDGSLNRAGAALKK